MLPAEIAHIYATEADLLNMALFGITAKQLRAQNLGKDGNLRDYTAVEYPIVLSNLESINAALIGKGVPQTDRLSELNAIAITQMRSLLASPVVKKLT